MRNKKIMNTYRWQPELSLSLTYWSLTFGVFFLGVIWCLEETRINLTSVIIFIFFGILFFYGCQRKAIIKENKLKIHALLKRNTREFEMKEIQKISVGSNGITIYLNDPNQKPISFIMFKKTKNIFLTKLTSEESFVGKVYSVEKRE